MGKVYDHVAWGPWIHRESMNDTQALRLATLLDASQVANISRAYAQQLEHQGCFMSDLGGCDMVFV